MNTPAPQPCLHPNARHQHGTRTAYVADKCRCPDCCTANTTYEQNRAALTSTAGGPPPSSTPNPPAGTSTHSAQQASAGAGSQNSRVSPRAHWEGCSTAAPASHRLSGSAQPPRNASWPFRFRPSPPSRRAPSSTHWAPADASSPWLGSGGRSRSSPPWPVSTSNPCIERCGTTSSPRQPPPQSGICTTGCGTSLRETPTVTPPPPSPAPATGHAHRAGTHQWPGTTSTIPTKPPPQQTQSGSAASSTASPPPPNSSTSASAPTRSPAV